MTTPLRIAKPPSGVLPVANVSTQPVVNGTNITPASSNAKPPAARLKLIVRRLPPGLTRDEFETTLGVEWKVGAGKVGWMSYEPGKVSKDPAKSSRPSRAYLQLTTGDHIPTLSQMVQSTKFADAANTADDSCLVGPPIVEFAPYGRTPTTKKRNDARQGTIDMDPEFISFLESLTQAFVKPSAIEAANGDSSTGQSGDKADLGKPVTPLIQHLREKKAAKEKAASAKLAARASKGGKQDATAESKGESKASKDSVAEKKSRSASSKKEKIISKETSKKPSTTSNSNAADPGETKTATSQKPASRDATNPKSTTGATGGGSGRGSAAAALIQRDLGIRGGRGGTASSRSTGERSSRPPKNEAPDSISKPASTVNSTVAPGSAAAAVQSKESTTQSSTPTSKSTAAVSQPVTSTKRGVSVTPGATAAFLKHANPSQGITEPLVQTAMSVFGPITKVELDKRKGFAYVDFATTEALRAAVEAGTVKIAEGAVVVMERRQPGPGGSVRPSNPSARGGHRGNTQSVSARGSTTSNTAPASTQPSTNVSSNAGNQSTSTTSNNTKDPPASNKPVNTTSSTADSSSAAAPPSGPSQGSMRGRGARGTSLRSRGGRGGRGRGQNASGATAPTPAVGGTGPG